MLSFASWRDTWFPRLTQSRKAAKPQKDEPDNHLSLRLGVMPGSVASHKAAKPQTGKEEHTTI